MKNIIFSIIIVSLLTGCIQQIRPLDTSIAIVGNPETFHTEYQKGDNEINITIKQEGNYVLDLILFPDIEEGIENIELDLNGDIIDEEKNKILSKRFISKIFLLSYSNY